MNKKPDAPSAPVQLHAPGAMDQDWSEDFAHENGCYMCTCCYCGLKFFGHKRRVVCRICSDAPKAQQSEIATSVDYVAASSPGRLNGVVQGETPRTDLNVVDLGKVSIPITGEWVGAPFARQLERELASANASLAFKSAQVDRIVVEEAAATKTAKERAKKAEAEVAALKHDIERQVGIANEYMRDAERYRLVRECAYLMLNEKDYKVVIGEPHEGTKIMRQFDAAIDAAKEKA